MASIRLTLPLGLISVVWLLQGCIGVAAHSSTYAIKASERDELRPFAESGDAQAQFELGRSYCCMGPGFDTQVATEWLCRAARQEHAGAMFELGRIYAGDVSRTLAPGQKVMKALRAQRSTRHALMWMMLAEQHGNEGAVAKLEAFRKDAAENVAREAEVMAAAWQSEACEYREVFPQTSEAGSGAKE